MLEENRISMDSTPAFKANAAPWTKQRISTRGMPTVGMTTGTHKGGKTDGTLAQPLDPLPSGRRDHHHPLRRHQGGDQGLRPRETSAQNLRKLAQARPALDRGFRWRQEWTTSRTKRTRTWSS